MRLVRILICLIFLILFLESASLLVSAPTTLENLPQDLTIAKFQNLSITQSKNPKIESRLEQISDQYKANAITISSFAEKHGVKIDNNSVRIILDLSDSNQSNIRAIEKIGAKIETSDKNLIQVIVPLSQLQTISDLAFVRYVRFPLEPYVDVVSEGVSVINATQLHTLGIRGGGVKVAIFDLGFQGYESKLGTELPSSVIVKSFRADGDISGGGEVHGTACAEIVHDVASDAQLYLVNFNTEIEFKNAVDWLISQNVDVISFSVGWVNAGPYDGTGYICDVVNNASTHGIFWSGSAGNEAQRHWEGYFNDPDNDGWHNFYGADETQNIYAISGTPITAFLSWDDWPRSNQDYDLYLLNDSLWIIAWSENLQNGAQEPTEAISYLAPYTGTYHIAIHKYSATRNVHFELYSFTNNFQYQELNSSLLIPADAIGSFTVGATYWANDNLEPFSSRGPTNDGRIKPDVTAPDGVSNSVYGLSSGVWEVDYYLGLSFFGTSASAPHVAGAAALLLSGNNLLTVSQLRYSLENGAKDLGAFGKDNLYGSGRIDLYKPYLITIPPASITNLRNISGNFWINWTWTNPSDPDFNYTLIYINNKWTTNTSNNYYNLTNLTLHNISTISTRTVDIYGNINNSWINQTTQIPNNPIFIIDIPTSITINENETLFIDVNAADLDSDKPVFSCNNTSLFKDFNATTGKGNFTPFYNQSGVYVIDFGVIDGWGSTNNTSIIITVIDIPLVITSQWNSYTNDSSGVFTGERLSTIFFNITTNRTPTYVRWYLNDALQQNSSSLNWTKKFDSTGIFIPSVSAMDQYDTTENSTWTITIQDTIPPPSVAGLSSDTPTQTTINLTWNAITGIDDLWGYEVLKDGNHLNHTTHNYFNVSGLSAATTYEFKIRANDTYNNWGANSSPLTITTKGPLPAIISWGNNITNDNQTDITVERLASVKFNATANQSINVWNWFKDSVNQNNNYDNITLNWNTIGLKTVKVNASNINGISNTITWNITVQDTTPPASITNLKNSSGNFWINWTWTNPSDPDFNYTSIYINNTWRANSTRNYYNYTDLTPHNISTISTRTVDIYGNMNTTWVNQTTQILNNNISIIDVPASKTINENETLYIDVNATDLDNDVPTFSCNRTGLFKDFNIAAGKGNFTPTFAQSGFYNINFGVSDDYGSISNKTMTITVIDIPLTITSYWNNKTGSNLVTACLKNEAIQFRVTANRTANSTWHYDGILEQNSSSINYTKQFTATGTHYINVSAYDQYDHTANITFTITIPVITASETQTIAYVNENNSTTFIYNNTSIVNSLSIIGNTNLTNVLIEVQELANVSSSLFMVNASGTPYAYFNIIATNVTNANLISLNITFTVNKSWLQSSGLDPNNVKLNRYHNNSWEVYPATKINETSTEITYITTNVPGLSIFAITAFLMPAPTPQPSEGGGGGGGGGAAPGEPYENIADTEVRYILAVTANKQNSVEFKKPTHHLMEIGFAYSQVADQVSVTLEKLINSSQLANGTPPGIVFENINIWVNVPNPNYVSNASVKFCVEKTWVSLNSIDANSIALYRFKDGAWNKLSTSKIFENETLLFYLASTPGFSPFAIAMEKLSAVPIATPTPGPAELPTTPTTTPTLPIPTPTKPAPGFDLIIAAIGVTILTYLLKRRF